MGRGSSKGRYKLSANQKQLMTNGIKANSSKRIDEVIERARQSMTTAKKNLDARKKYGDLNKPDSWWKVHEDTYRYEKAAIAFMQRERKKYGK